jgi:hypothetical protein
MLIPVLCVPLIILLHEMHKMDAQWGSHISLSLQFIRVYASIHWILMKFNIMDPHCKVSGKFNCGAFWSVKTPYFT